MCTRWSIVAGIELSKTFNPGRIPINLNRKLQCDINVTGSLIRCLIYIGQQERKVAIYERVRPEMLLA